VEPVAIPRNIRVDCDDRDLNAVAPTASVAAGSAGRWQQGLPALVPFASGNLDHVAGTVDVAYLEVCEFGNLGPAASRVASMVRWPRFLGASSTAFTSCLLKITGSFR
jgi:hypothetical protein